MNKRQKKEIEKLEAQHIQQFKNKSKQLKSEQVGAGPDPCDCHVIPIVDHVTVCHFLRQKRPRDSERG